MVAAMVHARMVGVGGAARAGGWMVGICSEAI